jgi:signal transduction histidine kinase
MNADTHQALNGPFPKAPLSWWSKLLGPVRQIPVRARDRHFWYVQLLVLAATAPHYIIEAAGYANPFETLHGLAITLYVIPLLYAALNFGWEGAILTALWGAALTSPSMWIWHRAEFHWFTELGQLAITLPVGILVAWRVTLESRLRQKAERTSASLSLLNEVGDVLSHTMEVEQQLPRVVRALVSGLGLESAWLFLEQKSGDSGPLVVVEGTSPQTRPPAELLSSLNRRLDLAQRTILADGRTVAVLLSGDAGRLGSLGAIAAQGDLLTDEQIDLLTTVASQVRVAIENATLYRQRQEALQSYVRQVTQAQEDERLRIARELHDATAQELVDVVRKLEQLHKRVGQDLAPSVEDLLAMARNTMGSIRRFSQDLRPSVLDDLGLFAALEVVVEDCNRRLSHGARLVVTGAARRLDGPVELALFRIGQESLRNVEKHAGASSALVELDFGESEVRLSVTDDGAGFAAPRDVAGLARIGKLGLLGMKERAELVGGRFELQSSPGKGTRVTVSLADRSLRSA